MRLKRGFSVLEAIVVLAITSLVLVLVFSIGSKATQTGFRLGRRALGVADSQVQAETVRAVLQGLVLPPERVGTRVIRPLVGSAKSLAADASPGRATLCAPSGPTGQVALTIRSQNGRFALFCQVGADAAREVVDFGTHAARFSYGTDALTWGDAVTVAPLVKFTISDEGQVRASTPRRLLVRLATDDGGFEVVERLSSGAPPPLATRFGI